MFLRVRLRLTLRNTRQKHWPDSLLTWYGDQEHVTRVPLHWTIISILCAESYDPRVEEHEM